MAPDPLGVAVAAIRKWLVGYSRSVWVKSPGLDDAAMAQVASRMVPAVQASQMRVATLTSSSVARDYGIPPLPPDHELITMGRGVDPQEVYGRPIVVVRSAIAEGKSYEDARSAGLNRLESLATTDLQMAKVRQFDASLNAAGKTYYRRVPQGAHTCALCLIASTQRYKVGNLLPIHPGCDCGVEAIPAGMDLDDLINPQQLLAATHAKVKDFTSIEDAGGRAVDYRKLLITRDHGEIGPLLAWNGQKFTDSKGIGGNTSITKATPAKAPSAQVKASAPKGVPKAATGSSSNLPPTTPPTGGQSVQPRGDDPRITAAVRTHILDGDKNGGGHRWTSTEPNKTLFPQRWDDDTAMAAVSDTIANPYTTSDDHDDLTDPVFLNLYGMTDGVRMVVRLKKADGTIDTGHPLDGDGVVRTDKKNGTTRKALPLGSVRNVPLPDGSV